MIARASTPSCNADPENPSRSIRNQLSTIAKSYGQLHPQRTSEYCEAFFHARIRLAIALARMPWPITSGRALAMAPFDDRAPLNRSWCHLDELKETGMNHDCGNSSRTAETSLTRCRDYFADASGHDAEHQAIDNHYECNLWQSIGNVPP